MQTFLLVTILRLIIAIICCHYAKIGPKKKCWHTNNIKKEKNNEFKKVGIKSRTCYYFDDIIKIEDLVFDSILLDKKSNENILIYDDLYKTLIGAKLLRIIFDKVDGFIRDYVEQNI